VTDVNVGAGRVTVNNGPFHATPPTVTTTLPVVAALGTVATMFVAVQLAAVAVVALNVTVLVPCVAPKFAPAMVTGVPTAPEAGDKFVMLGSLAVPVAVPVKVDVCVPTAPVTDTVAFWIPVDCVVNGWNCTWTLQVAPGARVV
jgi:hypothetical protein